MSRGESGQQFINPVSVQVKLLTQSIKQIYGECCPLYFEITGCPTYLLEKIRQGLDSSIQQILEMLSVAEKCQNQIDPVTLIETEVGVKHDRQWLPVSVCSTEASRCLLVRACVVCALTFIQGQGWMLELVWFIGITYSQTSLLQNKPWQGDQDPNKLEESWKCVIEKIT